MRLSCERDCSCDNLTNRTNERNFAGSWRIAKSKTRSRIDLPAVKIECDREWYAKNAIQTQLIRTPILCKQQSELPFWGYASVLDDDECSSIRAAQIWPLNHRNGCRKPNVTARIWTARRRLHRVERSQMIRLSSIRTNILCERSAAFATQQKCWLTAK